MTENKITEDMTIREVLDKYPETASVFLKYNIGCVGCIAASYERVKDISGVHGVDVKALLQDLNDAVTQS
jgi:hybrid cluster-associated redox disulfide protein